MAVYDTILQYVFLTAVVALVTVGAIIGIVTGYCFLREYVHNANERFARLFGDDEEDDD